VTLYKEYKLGTKFSCLGEIKAHKLLLSLVSDVFKQQFFGHFPDVVEVGPTFNTLIFFREKGGLSPMSRVAIPSRLYTNSVSSLKEMDSF